MSSLSSADGIIPLGGHHDFTVFRHSCLVRLTLLHVNGNHLGLADRRLLPCQVWVYLLESTATETAGETCVVASWVSWGSIQVCVWQHKPTPLCSWGCQLGEFHINCSCATSPGFSTAQKSLFHTRSLCPPLRVTSFIQVCGLIVVWSRWSPAVWASAWSITQ